MRRLVISARKDFMDSVRSRQLYLIVILFAIFGAGVGYFIAPGQQAGISVVAAALLAMIMFLGPLTGIYISYDVLVAKRNSGEMKVLLGLPFSRADLVAGALCGRSVLLAVMVSAAFVMGALTNTMVHGIPGIVPLAGALLVGLAITLVFVSISVGISANARNNSRAAGLAFLVFALFIFRVWDLLPTIINTALNQLSAPLLPNSVVNLYLQATPHAGLRNLVQPVFPELAAGFQPFVSVQPLSPLFGVVVVLLWGIGPLLVGYFRFGRADIAT